MASNTTEIRKWYSYFSPFSLHPEALWGCSVVTGAFPISFSRKMAGLLFVFLETCGAPSHEALEGNRWGTAVSWDSGVLLSSFCQNVWLSHRGGGWQDWAGLPMDQHMPTLICFIFLHHFLISSGWRWCRLVIVPGCMLWPKLFVFVATEVASCQIWTCEVGDIG